MAGKYSDILYFSHLMNFITKTFKKGIKKKKILEKGEKLPINIP